MQRFCYVFFSLLVLARAQDDPFLPGEYPVNHTQFLNFLTLHLDTNLDVFAPNAAGHFPVLYFIVGLGGYIPGNAYTKMLTHVASQGFIAAAVWKIGNPVASFDQSWLDETVNFVENYLERKLHNQGYDPDLRIDYEHSFLAGHSAGAHVVVAALQGHCLNYKGLILLNPVDGADPLGLLPIFVITPGEKVNFTIPTLEIMAGLDFQPGIFNITSCAPEELSGYRFFDAMRGPVWMVNATEYAHGDFLDENYENLIEITHFCATDPTTEKDPYRKFIAGQMVAFMRTVIDPVDSCSMLDYVEHNTLGVLTDFDYDSNGWEKCTPTQCINHETFDELPE